MCKLSKEKSKLNVLKKKSEDESYAPTLKKKERDRKAEQRRKKALLTEERKEENILEDENKVKTEDGQPALNKKVSKSRQSEAGLLLRRKNNKEKNLTIKAVKESSQSLEHKYEEMKTTLKETELEKIKLQTELNKKDNEIAAMKTKMKENDQYLKNTFKYMSKAGKAEFKNSYQLGKLEHPKGTTLRLLRNTGINMSKTILTPDQKKSELKTKIDKFAKENSS